MEGIRLDCECILDVNLELWKEWDSIVNVYHILTCNYGLNKRMDCQWIPDVNL